MNNRDLRQTEYRRARVDRGLMPWPVVRDCFNRRHGVKLSRQRIYEIGIKAEAKVREALASDPLVRDYLEELTA